MRKTCLPAAKCMCVLLLMASAGAPAFADGGPTFRYSVSLGGFSSGSFSAAEYSDISVSVEAPGNLRPIPGISAHFLLPVNPLSFAASLAGVSLDLTLFRLRRHPFSWVSPRETALAPMASAAAFFPFADPGDVRFALSLSPFRLFTGDAYYAAGAFSLVLDKSLAVEGWGVKLFEFSYLLY